MAKKAPRSRISYLLDFIILVLVIVLLAVIFIPKKIWNLEEKYRDECRERIVNIFEAEKEHFRLTETYSDDLSEMVSLIKAVKDTLLKDSTFIGARTVMIDSIERAVNIDENFLARYDTVFTIPITDSIIYCPLSKENYEIAVRESIHVRIECPIEKYEKKYYYFFTFSDTTHGNIDDGEKSWAKGEE